MGELSERPGAGEVLDHAAVGVLDRIVVGVGRQQKTEIGTEIRTWCRVRGSLGRFSSVYECLHRQLVLSLHPRAMEL
ncbi:hypothetical protein CDO52_17220 [Nocardiopsis gilva YIM 90087]|uniref:Uncharacterized protein n=1 Tax=Nocardiopsis gilva YIM 90087 TaxID=1235441 RepID=A0A223S850_9ACTN|nr:hypothetical protein CDO52_17220 [Nocardiopsis gilva YIM 90087]